MLHNFEQELKEYQRVQALVKKEGDDIAATESCNSAEADSHTEPNNESSSNETLPAEL